MEDDYRYAPFMTGIERDPTSMRWQILNLMPFQLTISGS
jgi:hypothetical protein